LAHDFNAIDRARPPCQKLGIVNRWFAKVIDGESLIGGGSLPGASLPTRLIAIGNTKKPDMARKVAQALRLQETPIIGRISDNILLLDPRTVSPDEDEIVVSGLIKAIAAP